MLLAIDIGNSNISVGVFELSTDNPPASVTTFKISASHLSIDEYTVAFKNFLSRSGLFDDNFSQINSITFLIPIIVGLNNF